MFMRVQDFLLDQSYTRSHLTFPLPNVVSIIIAYFRTRQSLLIESYGRIKGFSRVDRLELESLPLKLWMVMIKCGLRVL
jgi:hypothetical protein